MKKTGGKKSRDLFPLSTNAHCAGVKAQLNLGPGNAGGITKMKHAPGKAQNEEGPWKSTDEASP